jgi:hypothetical protein
MASIKGLSDHKNPRFAENFVIRPTPHQILILHRGSARWSKAVGSSRGSAMQAVSSFLLLDGITGGFDIPVGKGRHMAGQYYR